MSSRIFDRRGEEAEANDIEPRVSEAVEVAEEEAFGELGGSNGPAEDEEPGAEKAAKFSSEPLLYGKKTE